MLERLLQIITQEGIYNPAELATRLDASTTLVEQMLAHLERAGYIKALDACQPAHCQGCSIAGECGGKSPRLWATRFNLS